MIEIREGLHQSSIYIPPMDFTIHMYLLASDPAILFATGTVDKAREVLPEVRAVLGDRPLKYVFVSHMESDEVGGLGVFLEAYPDLTVICSRLAARELPGYGYRCKTLPMTDGDTLKDGELSLRFIGYPSEVHLQEGLVCVDESSGVFYSADMLLTPGDGRGRANRMTKAEMVSSYSEPRIPEADVARIKGELSGSRISFVAVGHGFCIDCGE